MHLHRERWIDAAPRAGTLFVNNGALLELAARHHPDLVHTP